MRQVLLSFDVSTLNPYFRYTGHDGSAHDVWFLDAVTVFNQARAALAIKPAGVALWRLGFEDPGAWASMGHGHLPDDKALNELKRPPSGNDIYARFRSDIVDLLPAHEAGSRRITFNGELGLIVGQTLDRVPKQDQLVSPKFAGPEDRRANLRRWPGREIHARDLENSSREEGQGDVLRHRQERLAQAGSSQADLRGGARPRQSHLFDPDLLTTPTREIEMELNATQRVLESRLGIHTILFRAPYASPNFKKELEAPRVLETANRLGYLTVTASVDAFDGQLRRQLNSNTVSPVASRADEARSF